MIERYPYIRFVVDAAQAIAGAVAAVVVLAGTISSCHRGGFGGFLSFLLSVAAGGIAYVAIMVQLEALQLLLDIDSTTRQWAAMHREEPPASTEG